MLTKQDETQLAEKGVTCADLEKQLSNFKTGFPFLKLDSAATINNGIQKLSQNNVNNLITEWGNYLKTEHNIVKFVPASGAASRMFKDLFAFLDAEYNTPTTAFEVAFFNNITQFAFYEALNKQCLTNEGQDIATLIQDNQYKAVVANLLKDKGLNYGHLPKGLLFFHRYTNEVRTAMEEHLVEAAQYTATKGTAKVHFTVSHEHINLFKTAVAHSVNKYEKAYNIKYAIDFSEQKPSTDTIAANTDNTPFREEDGSLVFRPGGHGALIQNLNELNADVVFIKNIDNVVPDHIKQETITWKKAIAGYLVSVQKKAFEYIRILKSEAYNAADLNEIGNFIEQTLCCKHPNISALSTQELAQYFLNKLNRPIRVCGMVKNSGEPGGGPFFAYNPDGTISLQILESSQIDKNNVEALRMFKGGTHFNPVDLVCGIKDYEGKTFNLPDFVDPQTGFISNKSKNGKELKALELPGLWNGAMSNWNTIFIEVPAITFNPVKTVNDLLRTEHQPANA